MPLVTTYKRQNVQRALPEQRPPVRHCRQRLPPAHPAASQPVGTRSSPSAKQAPLSTGQREKATPDTARSRATVLSESVSPAQRGSAQTERGNKAHRGLAREVNSPAGPKDDSQTLPKCLGLRATCSASPSRPRPHPPR